MTAPNPAIPSGPSVLIGSDNPRTAESLAHFLDAWRFHVEVATTGAEALTRLESATPPSLALLDMNLASPSATEVLWKMGMRPEQRRTWIALMSATPCPRHLHLALESGCDDYFPVPSDESELKLRIRIAERMRSLMEQISRQSAELRYQTAHDGLTGLWNREALLSLIFQETDRAQRMKSELCLMLLDLDDFSRINHDRGYQAGDRILAGLANRFRRQLRSYDLIGRCGEDEFLLALPGCSRESALALSARISETILGRPFAIDGEPLALSASFGISVSRGRSPVVVLREAEQALAEAKLAGRNCARCYTHPELPPPPTLLAEIAPSPALAAE